MTQSANQIVDARPGRSTVTSVTPQGDGNSALVMRHCGHPSILAAAPERFPRPGDQVDCPNCQVEAMPEPTETELAVVSQLALDNLVETLGAMRDEAASLLGTSLSTATISLHRVPAATWHAFPQSAEYATSGHRGAAWKYIATDKGANIVAYCEHAGDCPDLPKGDES